MSWPAPNSVMPVIHDSRTSMTLHFRSLLKMMDSCDVSEFARRKMLLEISETLLLNSHIRYPPSFVRNLIQKFEDANDILTFDRREYINCLHSLLF